MDARGMLAGSFVLGATLQIFLLARRPFPWMPAAFSALCAAFLFIPGKHETQYHIAPHLLFAMVVFGTVLVFGAQRSFLPVVREGMVWAMTLVLWFVLLLKWDLHESWQRWMALGLLLPSLWSLYLCWSDRPVSRAGKVADYLWFLAVMVLLGVWGYPFSPLALFGETNSTPWISPLEGFLGGMTFMMLLVYGTCLFLFIPLPGRSESMSHRLQEWRAFVASMAARFHAQRGNRHELAALSAVLIGIFLMHYWVRG